MTSGSTRIRPERPLPQSSLPHPLAPQAMHLRLLRGARLERVALVLIVAGAAALRLPGAITHPLWQDEVASARAIEEPTLSGLLDRVETVESTPPLWYLLAWLGRQAGIGVMELRLLSVVFSCALVVVVYRWSRDLVGGAGALVAAALAAAAWELVAHGRELRAYALYALLALLLAAAVTRLVASRARRDGALLAAAVAVGVATHYFFLLTVASVLLWLVATRGIARSARLAIAAWTACGLLVLVPLAGLLDAQYGGQRFDWIGSAKPLKVLMFFGTVFDDAGILYAEVRTPVDVQSVSWIAASLAVVAGCVLLARRSPRGLLCAFLTLGPVAIAVLVGVVTVDVFNTRNLLGVAPFAAIALAALVVRLPPRLVPVLAAGAVAAAAAVSATQPPVGLPGERAAAALADFGWTTAEPLALTGISRGFKSTIGWYTTGRPELVPVRCEEVVGRTTGIVMINITPITARLRSGEEARRVGPLTVMHTALAPLFLEIPEGRRSCYRGP